LKNIYFVIGSGYGCVPIVDPETIKKILGLTLNGNRNQIGSLLLNNNCHTIFLKSAWNEPIANWD